MSTDSSTSTGTEGDPFADPSSSHHHAPNTDDHVLAASSTLYVGRNASLTLATDALIVLDEGLLDTRPRTRTNCCGCGLPPLPLSLSRGKSTRSIPFFNVLWADFTKVDLTIHYATPRSRRGLAVRVAYMNYSLDLSSTASAQRASQWTARLLERAYGTSQRQKRIKLLINPYGGQGKAAKWYARDIEPIFAAARCHVDVERTAYSGHAVEIAEKLDINAYDVLASASGDGLPHECFNGLALKKNASEALRKVAVVQLPCGTGNAMSWNLNGTGDCSLAALAIVKGLRTPLDLASITQGERRTLSFLSTAIGIVAESDLGTDNIRWMGPMRFTYGVLVRLLGKTLYPCEVAVKTRIESKAEIKRHYAAEAAKGRREEEGIEEPTTSSTTPASLTPLRYGTPSSPVPSDWETVSYSNLGNLYVGNMTIMTEAAPFFPAALPCDGLMDLVTIDGDIGRMAALSLLLAVEKGTFFDQHGVRIRKVEALRVTPRFGRWGQAGQQSTSRVGTVLKAIGIHGGDEPKSGGDGGFIAVDGEKMPFEPFQLEVHPAMGTTLSRSGFLYESPGPSGWEEFRERGGEEM